MGPSIQMKGDTIEEAVKTALTLLGATIEEVNITVITSPSKTLFGLRKRQAEVLVEKKESGKKKQHSSAAQQPKKHEMNIDELLDVIDSLDVKSEPESATASTASNHQIDAVDSGASAEKEGSWAKVEGGRVFVQSPKDEKYPLIEPGENVRILVNGEEIKRRTAVTSMDSISVLVSDELIPAELNIQIVEQNMMAILSYTPEKQLYRTVRDCEAAGAIVVEADETVVEKSNISVQKVIEELRKLNVKHGILNHAIQEACERTDVTDYIVAKGTYPKEGLQGDVHVLIEDPEEVNWNEAEKVDYREKNQFVNVEEGEVIAEIIPAMQGQPGTDLFGNTVLPQQVKDVQVRLGKNVIMTRNHIVAMKGGRPQLEWRGMFLKADVMEELVHTRDVDLDSGHIYFPGDVRVSGSVQDSMKIEAGGNVTVRGISSKATIEAGETVILENNVFSSSISAGKSNMIIQELLVNVSEILYYLNHIILALKQLLMVRREKDDEFDHGELHQLMRLLMERKYTDFRSVLSRFVQKVIEHEGAVEPDWKNIAERLRHMFSVIASDQVKDLATIEEATATLQELYDIYCIPAEPGCHLALPYAINSTLYSSGDVIIHGKGIYHCRVRAGHDVKIHGVCRGGEIVSGNEVVIDEVGSDSGSKTTIQVPETGIIKVNIVHEETTIQIGRRVHTFAVPAQHIRARLNKDGYIALY